MRVVLRKRNIVITSIIAAIFCMDVYSACMYGYLLISPCVQTSGEVVCFRWNNQRRRNSLSSWNSMHSVVRLAIEWFVACIANTLVIEFLQQHSTVIQLLLNRLTITWAESSMGDWWLIYFCFDFFRCVDARNEMVQILWNGFYCLATIFGCIIDIRPYSSMFWQIYSTK